MSPFLCLNHSPVRERSFYRTNENIPSQICIAHGKCDTYLTTEYGEDFTQKKNRDKQKLSRQRNECLSCP